VEQGYWAEVQTWLETINKTAIVGNLVVANPHTIAEGARMAPFCDADYTTRAEQADKHLADLGASISAKTVTPFYSCGGVLFWANLLASPVPGVQINIKDVARVQGQEQTYLR
jgi:hypothetical protein